VRDINPTNSGHIALIDTQINRMTPMTLTHNFSRCLLSALTLTISFALSACGGGSDEGSPNAAGSQTGKHGAIAFGSNSTSFNTGLIANATTQDAANESALNSCERTNCAVVLEFNECGALAVGKNAAGSFVWGAASAATASSAKKAAGSACAARGGLGCTLGNLQPICNAV
jgi:hypothetical protein